jgi:hypothetical protein
MLSVCGGGSGPSTSTPATTTPPASPAPAPSPTATPGPAATACSRLAPAPHEVTNCPRENPTFLSQVNEAINRLQQQQPEIFNGDQVLSNGRYYVGLIENLGAQGICADFDGEELQATNSSGFSDQYHVLTSKNMVHRGESSYRATCYPAALPVPAPALAPTAGCSLAPSREKSCGRENAIHLGEVEQAIAKAIQEHPEFFDTADVQGGTDWVKVRNDNGYINAVVENLTKAGGCARFDGEELAVKRENRVSEQYDIHTSQGYIRRGAGSYRTSCYPAAF